MPSFDPQLPISNAICVEGSTIHPHCATYFGVFLEDDAIDLSPGAVFNSAKERTQAIPSDPLTSGALDKKQSSSVQVESQRLPLEKVQRLNRVSIPSVGTENWGETQKLLLENIQQSNQVSIPSVNTENWGETNMADASPRTDISTDADTDDKNQRFDGSLSTALVASDSSDRSKDKMDQKTLRRLAQNREAARKSRLRKKAYVQQLESSRLKLTQLEQELQRARQQGIFVSSSGDQSHSMSGNGAMAFDVEYARWLEDQNRQINELRSAVNSHTGDTELRIIIDGIMAHYDEVFRLKSNAAKADVFHLLSGMWKTPAERCFLWLGGFRSSELLKLLVNQLEPLTDQQLVGIGNLQQSSQQAEDALSQGMEALQQSLAETLSSGSLGSSGSSGNVANYMGQMAMAMGKLGTLEGFIRQADNLRQQTLQQMQRILTTRQSARALLAIHDYFSRLRALSSLWLARPRE
ncbi:hypothetical protein POPTR_001G029800v4 [Populus trichocarpa]|uniref:BZIP family protein n=2 Tax=Populus TaxID=3689 RepID=A0A2K2BRJ0_POPTR|nr:transcription factor TGA2 isoform X1 [Populus trichocarpa]XP_024446963.1 transcription factor TGA2 isoform X1 [Populus trichocarpa]AXY97513.1 TGACG motif-binding factor 6 [Populus tomentosa]KAI5600486.1 hypothetical protein BDE02_01G027900 [Populus trichocarpa]KAI5600487.1 hypothetical protein BDE02_01G027900 [Populus trichocarpa]KAI5600488.1 hypothetical protein BDE02_01G027900 [Populus trichocarpa]PNT52395.1 hypothetical protein POPTR_001G029800v4 [Populus trichocarpa]|eukprot:XP_024446961.1 transcription factor TGA2 isoform X1 [Populus trichocarpa]